MYYDRINKKSKLNTSFKNFGCREHIRICVIVNVTKFMLRENNQGVSGSIHKMIDAIFR